MLSTKNVELGGGGKLPKVLEPGMHLAKINDIKLVDSRWPSKEGNPQFDVILSLEGQDLGEGFEGFFIDKDNESLGRYKGQIAQVNLQRYAFEKDPQNAYQTRVLREMKNLAFALGLTDQIDAIEADTIEDWIKKAAEVFVSSELYAYYTIAGREYTNKAGYKAYNLFLARPDYKAKRFPFALNEEDALPYSEDLIIKEKKAEAVPQAELNNDLPF